MAHISCYSALFGEREEKKRRGEEEKRIGSNRIMQLGLGLGLGHGIAATPSGRSLEPEAPNAIDRRRRRIFLLGTGFVARHVSLPLLQQGWHVSGTCTTSLKKNQLRSVGIDAHLFDANHHKLTDLQTLRDASHVLVSIPPTYPIGVYGDCGGAWVDEDYPVNPTSQSAKSRYEAEKGWTNFGLSLGLSTFIFRLGGIYGPGRSALDTLMKRKDLSENQKRRDSRDFYYTSRIHVADICQAILSSIVNPYPGKIYNVVDDDPAPRAEVFAFAWDLISRRYPEMVSDFNHVSLGDVQPIIGEKCVSNMRMKKELGVQLIYPSYKSGLQSIFDSWSSSF